MVLPEDAVRDCNRSKRKLENTFRKEGD